MNSRDLSKALARQLARIRGKKIKKLRTKITSGKYQVNSEAIARALVLIK